MIEMCLDKTSKDEVECDEIELTESYMIACQQPKWNGTRS